MTRPGTAAPKGGALARCVADPDAFLATGWGHQPIHTRQADPDGYAELLSLDSVDRLVSVSGLRAPAIRMVKGGAAVPPASYTRSARVGSRTVPDLVDAAGVFAQFHEGATIVLQGLHRYWPPVTAFCRDLELALSHPVQANAYITPPTSSGLRVHADGHDVFALQMFGRKHWVVYEGTADGAQPLLDLLLKPGDALYLPRGTRHAARTVDEPSAHLTIGVHATTWADVLQRVTDRLVREAEFSQRLPAGFARDDAALAGMAARILTTFAERVGALEAADVAGEERRRFLGARQPSLRGMLADMLSLDRVSDSTPVRRRPGTVCEVERNGECVRMLLGDRTLHMPARLEPAVRLIAGVAQGGTMRPVDLAGELDAPGRLVLVRRLVREGLLTFAATADAGPGAAVTGS